MPLSEQRDSDVSGSTSLASLLMMNEIPQYGATKKSGDDNNDSDDLASLLMMNQVANTGTGGNDSDDNNHSN